MMNDSVAEIIRQLLLDLNLGDEDTKEDWAVFVGILPDAPTRALCVYNTSGRQDGRLMKTGERIDHPGIQIMIRAFNFVEAEKRARMIAQELDLQIQTSVTMSSSQVPIGDPIPRYTIQNISRTGDILPLGVGEDDRGRFHFSINAVLTIKEG